MRVCSYLLSACLLSVVACATEPAGPADSVVGQGITELRVDASAFAALELTRVTVEVAGQTQDLVFNPSNGSFDGAVVLAAGRQTVVARAFSDETLIGASNPTTVDVQVGVVTRVLLRIIDQRLEMPTFGPAFDSLSFPTTIQAGSPVTFALSVFSPGGEPLDYAWESDCQDDVFGSPAAATTTWSKSTQGTCTISVSAFTSRLSLTKQFNVVVFPEGTQSGGLDVSGDFIVAPRMALFIDNGACFMQSGFSSNATCSIEAAQPRVTNVSVSSLGWGLSTPGTLALSDNCGGTFGTQFGNSDALNAVWLPPVAGGLCIIKATAVNGDGGVGTLSAAIVTRAGTPATGPTPQISAFLSSGCSWGATEPGSPAVCGVFPGSLVTGFFSAFTPDGFPLAYTVTDDCGGGEPTSGTNSSQITRSWTAPLTSGQTCSVTVTARSFFGVESVGQATLTTF